MGSVTVRFDGLYTHWKRLYIPHMGKNLISMWDLERKGFAGILGEGVMKILKGVLRAFKATRINGIYIMHVEVMGGINSSIVDTNYTKKWQNRLAYISVKELKFLNDKDMFGKDQVFDMPFCDHCVLGKYHRMSFTSSTHKTFRVLEYIYSGLWVWEAITFGGNKCFLSITDDFSWCA